MLRRYYCILFFFLATGSSAQIRFEAGLGYLRNNYHIGNDESFLDANSKSGGGGTIAFRLSHVFFHSKFDPTIGLSMTNYQGTYYTQTRAGHMSEGFSMGEVSRTELGFQILPIKFAWKKTGAQFNFGIQANVLVYYWFNGSFKQGKSDSLGHFWLEEKKYSERMKGEPTAGFLGTLAFPVFRSNNWGMRYTFYWGILPDIGNGRGFSSVRNILELTFSEKL